MAVEVIMPKVDMDQEAGTVIEWLKKEGDFVNEGEPLLVIETDKVSIEVQAPGSGLLSGISAYPQDERPIGAVIAYLLEPGETPPETKSPSRPEKSPETQALHQEIHSSPLAQRLAEAKGIDIAGVAGSGPGGRVMKSDVIAALETAQKDHKSTRTVRATPAARRIARQMDVDLSELHGSGPRGRIQAADLDAAKSETEAKTTPERIQLSATRRLIAERMTASYREIPHIDLTSRMDFNNFEEARTVLNQEAEANDWEKISMTALLVKMTANTLKRYPMINSKFEDNEILIFPDVNIGIAVAFDEGLIVPVVRNADRKSIPEIAAEVSDLSLRARSRNLSVSEVKNGTFTISNLGPFGIEQFKAIINSPQAGILAIGAMQKEVVVLEDDRTEIRPVVRMTLSVDHRIVDGAAAANFMSDLREIVENPILLLTRGNCT